MILDEQSFVRELEHEIERAKRGSRRLSVLVAQLGGLGEYDFVGGQRTSDPLLDSVGDVLLEQKRQIDVVASLGQGRFAMILPETGEPGALTVAERLKASVAAVISEHGADPRVSFGAASFGRHGRSANALLATARRAASGAKQPGGTRRGLGS